MNEDVKITLLSNDEENFIEGIDINGKLFPRKLDRRTTADFYQNLSSEERQNMSMFIENRYNPETIADFIDRVSDSVGIDLNDYINENEGKYYVQRISDYELDSKEVVERIIKDLRISSSAEDKYHIKFSTPDSFKTLNENLIPVVGLPKLYYFEAKLAEEGADYKNSDNGYANDDVVKGSIQGYMSLHSFGKAFEDKISHLDCDEEYVVDFPMECNIRLGQLEVVSKYFQQEEIIEAKKNKDNKTLEKMQNKNLDVDGKELHDELDQLLKKEKMKRIKKGVTPLEKKSNKDNYSMWSMEDGSTMYSTPEGTVQEKDGNISLVDEKRSPRRR